MRFHRCRGDERGIALVLALFLVTTMSVLAAALMFLSQTETYSSMNYKVMSQARYAAESGVEAAANYLLNTYVPPGQNPNDPIAKYDMTKSPVQVNGKPVILSAMPPATGYVASVTSNYPVDGVQAAFNAAGKGTLAVGVGSASYNAYVTMLSMQVVNGQTVISWQITSDGTITTGRPATVEVTAIMEKQITPFAGTGYSAFATAATCGAISLGEQSIVDSFDSTALNLDAFGKPITDLSGGNVGTNGNLTSSGGGTMYGNLYTPKTGVGKCSAGNVDAASKNAVKGQIINLAAAVTAPTPPLPNPLPDPNQNIKVNKKTTYPPGTYGNLAIGEGGTIHLSAGTYDVNSFACDEDCTLVIDSGPVIINIVGAGANGGPPLAQPLSFGEEGLVIKYTAQVQANWDATQLQINYAGTGTIHFGEESTFIGQINAPNAAVGGGEGMKYYGSLVASTIHLGEDSSLHLDRHLAAVTPAGFTVGADLVTSFTWKKY